MKERKLKKGSILLLALFLILFVTTIVSILYLTNKRYVMLAKEQVENRKNFYEHQKNNLSLYIINSFIKNQGVINIYSSLNKIYSNKEQNYELYKINCDLSNKNIYYHIINNLIYANIYNNGELYRDNLLIFQKNLMNLYKSNQIYTYMPDDIKKIFSQFALNSNERKILEEYKKILIEYIMDTFGVNQENSLNIIAKFNYGVQQSLNSIYQSSKRKINVAIKFKVGGQDYLITSNFEIKNQLIGINLYDFYKDQNLSFIGKWKITTDIYQVERTKIEKINDLSLLDGYPYSF
ncbi:MAG: hypothetical protein ACK4GJ_01020 [bacterium]